MEYLVDLKQLVKYPRCRIYRQFIRNLMENRSIRTSGCSFLFYFIVLSSYANFRTSYHTVNGSRYIIEPGEWVCTTAELTAWFRLRFRHQTLGVLRQLQERHLLTFTTLSRDTVVKFKITGWVRSNKIIDSTAPCQKDMGFFFFPISTAQELVRGGRCSEMDILLDLWIQAIYNDPQVPGSELGPVVYLRTDDPIPLVSYDALGTRWGISKSSVGRILKKLAALGHLQLMTFPGRHGTAIYLSNYLSVMFSLSDVSVDKENVALSMNIRIPDAGGIREGEYREDSAAPTDAQIIVSTPLSSVPETHINIIVRKVAQVLAAQGLKCSGCPDAEFLLSNLSDCGGAELGLEVICGRTGLAYEFELSIFPNKTNTPARPERL